VNTVAYSNLPKGKSNNASALMNLMRNLGGSIGIAFATTMLTRREQFHQNRLVANLTPTSSHYRDWLSSLGHNAIATGVPGGHGPGTVHLLGLGRMVRQQASMLSYVDVFKIMEITCAIVLVTVLFTRRVKKGQAAAAH